MRKTSGGGSKLLWFGGRRLVVQRGEVGGVWTEIVCGLTSRSAFGSIDLG